MNAEDSPVYDRFVVNTVVVDPITGFFPFIGTMAIPIPMPPFQLTPDIPVALTICVCCGKPHVHFLRTVQDDSGEDAVILYTGEVPDGTLFRMIEPSKNQD